MMDTNDEMIYYECPSCNGSGKVLIVCYIDPSGKIEDEYDVISYYHCKKCDGTGKISWIDNIFHTDDDSSFWNYWEFRRYFFKKSVRISALERIKKNRNNSKCIGYVHLFSNGGRVRWKYRY